MDEPMIYPSVADWANKRKDETIVQFLKRQGVTKMSDPFEGIFSQADREVAEKLRQDRVDKEVEKRLEMIKYYGPDTYPEGTVLKFTKVFEATPDKEYLYVALKVAGGWYTSGPKGSKYTYDELLMWLVSGPKPVEFDNVTRMSDY
jgi:hypothetical protein